MLEVSPLLGGEFSSSEMLSQSLHLFSFNLHVLPNHAPSSLNHAPSSLRARLLCFQDPSSSGSTLWPSQPFEALPGVVVSG